MEVFKTEQVIRVLRPTIHTSGDYTCRVATFMMEQAATHTLIIFGNNNHYLSIHYKQLFHYRPWGRPLPLTLLPAYLHQPVLLGLPGLPRAVPLPYLVQ